MIDNTKNYITEKRDRVIATYQTPFSFLKRQPKILKTFLMQCKHTLKLTSHKKLIMNHSTWKQTPSMVYLNRL